MKGRIFRFLFVSSLMSLCLALSAIDAFAQCGPDGTQPCNTTPKKTTPKPTTKPKPKPTVSKPIIPTKKPQTNVVKPKPQSKFVSRVPSIEMVKISAGSFMMGSENGNGDEKPVHKVTISQDFWMGKTEVTQAQWKAVMGNNPSDFKGDDLPVEQVSWNDVEDFIIKLNNLQNDYIFRLPTEEEWEYATRAGTTGDYTGNLHLMAWYSDNSGEKTHSVGQKQANAFGLYDMHGNVWERTADWYGSYPGGTVTDPTGAASGSKRVYRGGGWSYTAGYLRSAIRYYDTPSERSFHVGFRVVRQ
jgi:formylglycine-generating enzyme required for sulfatase activity